MVSGQSSVASDYLSPPPTMAVESSTRSPKKRLGGPLPAIDEPQHEVDALLRRAFAYAMLWLMGAGSIRCLMLALRAARIIADSKGELTGMRKVAWCFFFGGAGLLLALASVGAIIYGILTVS